MYNRQQPDINTTNCLQTKAIFIGPGLQFSAHSSSQTISNRICSYFLQILLRIKCPHLAEHTQWEILLNKTLTNYDIKFVSVKRAFKSSEFRVFLQWQQYSVCETHKSVHFAHRIANSYKQPHEGRFNTRSYRA